MSDTQRIPENPLLAEYARQFFQNQIEVIKKCLHQLDAGEEDSETIHDLRVAARRFTSLCKQLEPYLDPEWCRKAVKTLRPVRKVTNRLRDLAVLIKRLEATPAEIFGQQDSTVLIENLVREQTELLKKARIQLADHPFLKSLNQLSVFLQSETSSAELIQPLSGSSDTLSLFRLQDVRLALLSRQTAVLLAHRQLVVSASELPPEVLADPLLASRFLEISPEVIHRIRLSGKDFRYVLEFLSPVLLPESLKNWLGSFKALQDQLGTVHDLDLAMARLNKLEKQGFERNTCEELKRAWREERQTLLDLMQNQWSEWTADGFECKIYNLIFQKLDPAQAG